MIRSPVGIAIAAVLLHFPPAGAWDLFGHHVVGAVAWEHMEPKTRLAVAELLQKAPPDADLASLLPPGPRAYDLRIRELYIKAQGWADLVRDEIWSQRKERYDHPDWHYVNRFWTPTASGPRALPERGTLGELSKRLHESISRTVDPALATGERAVALAWVVHLVGDAHHPLHSSGRVTDLEPEGDRGGNDFALDDLDAPNLHAFWDTILVRARPQDHREGYFRWVSRVAQELMTLHPRQSLAGEVAIASPEEWSKEGAAIAMSGAYPEYLARGTSPPGRYRDDVFRIAARQAALGGYRQARLLDGLFGKRSESAPDLLPHQIP
ncbi:MAG: S1/P1 nuclease [Vicinamibacteria bacterium]